MTIVNRSTTALWQACAIVALCAACSNGEAARQRYVENGNQYLTDKKYQEAIVEYRNALQQDENSGEVRLKLAEAYAGSGNAAAAVKESVRAADLLPDNSAAQIKAVTFLLLTR